MNLDARRLALSLGGATIVVWFICSALVALIPGPMGTLTGHMLHANLENFGWTLTWAGFFLELVPWVLWVAAAGWLIAWFYNRFGSSRES